TSVPGTRICELLPLSAGLLHKVALIRSLSHRNANHVQASLPALTGHAHPPEAESRDDFPPSPTDFPPFGAVLSALRPARSLPARRDLLRHLDHQRRGLDRTADVRSLDAYQQRAFNLLSSPATARAFQLAAEPTSVRDRYGRTQFGQCCLLARRLAEAGVPLINVHYCRTPAGSWDTHGKHFAQMKTSLCPTFDRAFSRLVQDLDERGLLAQTLVLATAEFGRTPKVNKNGGR